MQEIDFISRRYGVLPSSILKNSIIELQFDMFVASIGVEEENKASEKARRQIKARGR